jgi:hypothetical protein
MSTHRIASARETGTRARRSLTAVLITVVVGACGNAPTGTAPASSATAGPSLIPGATLQASTEHPDTPPPTAVPTAAPSAPASIAGTWHGTWASTTYVGLAGGFTLNFQQSGSSLSGTILITGSACISSATITGTLSGSQITFGAVKGAETVTYSGTWTGGAMSGAWAVTQSSGGQCTADAGSWQAAR